MTAADDGFTGTNFERPEFKQMMADAQNGVINTIIIKDLSRFGRHYIQVGNYMSEILPAMGVRFIAIGDDVDTADENLDYDLTVPIKNVINEFYPADCSRKTRQAFIAKAQNGEYIGSQPPYGYKKAERDKHILEIDEMAAPTVVWMFEMAAYHGYGYNKIARVLTERKIITPAAYQARRAGKCYDKNPYEWNLVTVYKMLQNEVYLGHLISGKRRKASYKSKRIVNRREEDWIVVRDNHPALITEQLWKDAHKRLGSRKYESRTGVVNIFAGLVKCGTCGYALGIASAKDRANYYSCNTYKKKGPRYCSSHYIRYDDLYSAVLADIRQVIGDLKRDREAFIKMLRRKVDDVGGSETHQLEQEVAQLQAKINALEARYDRLCDDRMDGLISDKKFKELAAKCEAEQDAATERMEQLQKQLAEESENEQDIDLFVEIAEQYDEVEALDKELLNRLIESIVVGDRVKTDHGYEQEVTVNYRFIGGL